MRDYSHMQRCGERVGLTWVGPYRISTVFLALDHQYGDGPPLLYETMVFEGDGSKDLDMERYTTLEQAQAGHAAMVKKWEATYGGD